MKGFIVYPSYVNVDNQTYVQLFGRLENGDSFVSMSKFDPYLFIRKIDKKKTGKLLKDGIFKVEETKLTNFSEENVVKISVSSQTDLNKLKDSLHKKEIDTFEGDLKPHFRFMFDKNLKSSIEIDGDYENSERVDRVYKNPEISSSDFKPKLKIASVDIESGKIDGDLFCIGIYSDSYEKCFLVGKEKGKNIVNCDSEEDCLEKFKEALKDLDPDIITGWNVIDFDFVFLKNLFAKHKIGFDLGRTNENSKIRIESDFFRSSKMDVSGRLVLDGLNFIKDPFIKEAPSIKNKKFESYTLENVAESMLGDTKLLVGKDRHKEIENLFEKNQKKLVQYNLKDCELVYKILEKSNMIDLAVERSQLTGMPLDRITSSILSFDSLYIRAARKKGLVSPTQRFNDKAERIKGGFVMEPVPGIYSNVMVFDFKSLYPSIIRTFNIDPASFLRRKNKGCIVSPNGACFKNVDGILPEIISDLHFAREKAKKEGREFSNHAIKVIMNSFFGVLASPNCRYFNLDIANAITNFGQELIKKTSKRLEDEGFKVLYGDTDSIFIKSNLSETEANKIGKKIEKDVNNFYDDYVLKNFKRKSFLELEFEKLYSSLMMPKVRGSAGGAKKRYAGFLKKGGKKELEVVGLEAIRGDWTEAAQDFQIELLKKVFEKENVKKFVKDYVKLLNSGKLDSKLIYRKQIRKDLKEYVKTTPPHVKAARKLDSLDGNLIEYYVTIDGPEPIQKKKHKIDYEHYTEKQIKPIANQVLGLLGDNFEDVVSGESQGKLF